jgi:hypothetical protein
MKWWVDKLHVEQQQAVAQALRESTSGGFIGKGFATVSLSR